MLLDFLVPSVADIDFLLSGRQVFLLRQLAVCHKIRVGSNEIVIIYHINKHDTAGLVHDMLLILVVWVTK